MNINNLAAEYGAIIARARLAQRVPPHVAAKAEAAIRDIAMRESRTIESVRAEVIRQWESTL